MGVVKLKEDLTIYNDIMEMEDMEDIWQHAHFLIYIANNDVSNIHGLSYAENAN